MAKMYYSEEEAADILGVRVEKLTQLAREGKLQQYQDGTKKVYRAGQVDELAASRTVSSGASSPGEIGLSDTSEIELAPGDSVAELSLADSEMPMDAPGKEDTVITAEGISIFDDEDLEIQSADPLARTEAPMDDQISLDSGGSGLLDLTRESDDTSLGAEVLDHIDMESSVAAPAVSGGSSFSGSALGESALGGSAFGESALGESALGESALGVEVPPAYSVQVEQPVAEPVVSEVATDPTAGVFSGLVVGAAMVALLLGVVSVSVARQESLALADILKDNLLIVVGATAAVAIVCGVVGMVLGKSISTRQAGSEG